MKKSIASKIEHLLCSLMTSSDQRSKKVIASTQDLAGLDPDNMHYELNPDRPVKTKLPARLLELLRPKRNPEFYNR